MKMIGYREINKKLVLDDINELKSYIHKVIYSYQDAERQIAHNIDKLMVGYARCGGVDKPSANALMFMDSKSSVQAADESFVEKAFDTTVQCGKNIINHPVDTGFAVLGVGLGTLGVIGSGAIEYFTVGAGTPVAVPVALFSTNTIIASSANLGYIASGNYKKQGNINPLKSSSEFVGGIGGKLVDISVDKLAGKKSNFTENGKNTGEVVFEIANLYMGAKGVKLIADNSYKLKVIENAGGKIVPNMTVAVNNVSKPQKVGKAVSIGNTVSGWTKKSLKSVMKNKYSIMTKIIKKEDMTNEKSA